MATDAVSNDPSQVPPVVPPPAVDHLVTEDNAPVDNVFSEKQQRLLTEPLHTSWADPARQRPFVAMSNVGLFYSLIDPPLVPDMMLSLDVELPADVHHKRHRSYFVWEFGKVPDVVIEMVSNREGGEDKEKQAAYASLLTSYYVIFDPKRLLSAEVLRGYRLETSEFTRMYGAIEFPNIGLGLRLWQGRYADLDSTWLRWVDAAGVLIPTGHEQRQRAERLAEQLRQIGAEPAA